MNVPQSHPSRVSDQVSERPEAERAWSSGTVLVLVIIVGGLLIGAGAFVGRLQASAAARREAQQMLRQVQLPLPDFQLVDQLGRPVTPSTLKGKIWVVSCFFTRCSTVCPGLIRSVKELAEELRELRGVKFLTVSVDPKHDRPEVLREYARIVGADPEQWLFATGDKEEVYRFVREGLKLSASETPKEAQMQGADPVTHSTRLVLLDANGAVRGYADTKDPWSMSRLQHAIELLRAEASGAR